MTDLGVEENPAPEASGVGPRRWWDRVLSPNASKRAAEKYYFCFFLASVPMQVLVLSQLSFEPGTHNDVLLVGQGVVMGAGAWFGSLLFRAEEDRGRPFYEAYGFKLGCFLAVWAMVGGYLGTDPWYEVMHGHFGFNTDLNPNGVPLFMLPMTIAVFGFYTVILGSLFRVGFRAMDGLAWLQRVPRWALRVGLVLPLACLMPLVETVAYSSDYYCFDDSTGKWWLNVLIYGCWQGAALLFYPAFDEKPGERQPIQHFVLRGFAAVGVLMFATQILSEFIAPHFTDVLEGARYVNDWAVTNCLGPRPS